MAYRKLFKILRTKNEHYELLESRIEYSSNGKWVAILMEFICEVQCTSIMQGCALSMVITFCSVHVHTIFTPLNAALK